MKISIFGLGYVGCVSLGCLAKNGHEVIGVDAADTKVEFVNSGKSPIVEKEIDTIISEQHKLGRISATSDSIDAVKKSELSFMCVGTPSTMNGHLNLDAIYNVSAEIAKGIAEKDTFHVVVIRSTVLPGTNEKVTRIIEESSGKQRDKDFATVSNPEFMREGTAVQDYYSPPYTIIGSGNEQATQIVRNVYDGIDAPFVVTDIKVAEFMKYASNAFHALKITFANEIGNVCKKLEINSHDLMDIFCMDTKLNISPYYLKPGFCYGGSCLPKDLKALATIAHDFYLESPVIESIEKSNEVQRGVVLNKLLQLNKNKIGFLGLSFKGGTDDLRNSPIIDVIEQLLGKGFEIRIFDKNVHFAQLMGANREYILQKIPYISKFIVDDPDKLVQASEILVVVNKEKEFAEILEKAPEDTLIYDLVNIDFKGKENNSNYVGIAW